MITSAIAKVVTGTDLSDEEMEGVMTAIMTGTVSAAQLAAFLVAMRMKGESVNELTAAARVMRCMAEKPVLEPGTDGVLLDTWRSVGRGQFQ